MPSPGEQIYLVHVPLQYDIITNFKFEHAKNPPLEGREAALIQSKFLPFDKYTGCSNIAAGLVAVFLKSPAARIDLRRCLY